MNDHIERRRYYPVAENVPLSESIREAVVAHDRAVDGDDNLERYESVDLEAIDGLFASARVADVDISLHLDLDEVSVGVWIDSGVDIRVSDDSHAR